MICIRKDHAGINTPFYMILNKSINKVVYLTDPNTFNAGLYDVNTKNKILDLIIGGIPFRVELKEKNINFFKV